MDILQETLDILHTYGISFFKWAFSGDWHVLVAWIAGTVFWMALCLLDDYFESVLVVIQFVASVACCFYAWTQQMIEWYGVEWLNDMLMLLALPGHI